MFLKSELVDSWIVGRAFGTGDGVAAGDELDDGVGAELLALGGEDCPSLAGLMALRQTNFFPFLVHINLMPMNICIFPTFGHFDPGAKFDATEEVGVKVKRNINAIPLVNALFIQTSYFGRRMKSSDSIEFLSTSLKKLLHKYQAPT